MGRTGRRDGIRGERDEGLGGLTKREKGWLFEGWDLVSFVGGWIW
jgi:hypothetical protein